LKAGVTVYAYERLPLPDSILEIVGKRGDRRVALWQRRAPLSSRFPLHTVRASWRWSLRDSLGAL